MGFPYIEGYKPAVNYQSLVKEKLVAHLDVLEEVGQRIEQAQERYQTVRKRLTDGQGNLVRQVEMLRELGAENSKELPEAVQNDLQEGLPNTGSSEGRPEESE